MLKSLQVRPQQYMNCELPDVLAGFRKGRGTRDQIANIHWIIKKTREFQKKKKESISALLTMPKPLAVWITINCGKFWKRWEYQTSWPALRNLYAGKEATVRIGHGKTHWFQMGKGVHQGCILLPCSFNFMQSTSWETLGWRKHKLESRLLGEISVTSAVQMTAPLWQKVKN